MGKKSIKIIKNKRSDQNDQKIIKQSKLRNFDDDSVDIQNILDEYDNLTPDDDLDN